MSDTQPLDTVIEIMRATRIAILTYVDERGRLVSTPMGTQDFEEPGTVYFLTEKDTAKVAAIAARPQVNVAYSSNEGWVSLTGTAALVEDRAKLKELWDASADIFMEGDADDPDAGLLVVTGETAEYWDSPGKVATAVQMVKGLVTDVTPDLGDSGTVPV
jgi:general stress protein 26